MIESVSEHPVWYLGSLAGAGAVLVVRRWIDNTVGDLRGRLAEGERRLIALEGQAVTQETLDRHMTRLEEVVREGLRDLRSEIAAFHRRVDEVRDKGNG